MDKIAFPINTIARGKMRRLAAAVFIICVFAGPAIARPKSSSSSATSKSFKTELDVFIARGMNDWKIPGLSIVVVKDGSAVYEKGFGVRRLGSPALVDAQTLFGMMSTTKAMTALYVAMLVDEGNV